MTNLGKSNSNLRKPKFDEKKNKMSESKMGDKNPRRIHRRLDQILSPDELYGSIKCQKEFREWQKAVKELYGSNCVECRREEVITEVHHIIPLLEIIQKYNLKTLHNALNCCDVWDVSNGLVLCRSCHMKSDGRINNLKGCTIHPFLGKHRSEVTRNKIGKSLTGRKIGPSRALKAWETKRRLGKTTPWNKGVSGYKVIRMEKG